MAGKPLSRVRSDLRASEQRVEEAQGGRAPTVHNSVRTAAYHRYRGGLRARSAAYRAPPRRDRHALAVRALAGDVTKQAYNGFGNGSLVERKTRFCLGCTVDSFTQKAALKGFTRQLKSCPLPARELTYDLGSEMYWHADVAECLSLAIWIADSRAPLAAR